MLFVVVVVFCGPPPPMRRSERPHALCTDSQLSVGCVRPRWQRMAFPEVSRTSSNILLSGFRPRNPELAYTVPSTLVGLDP